MVAPSFWGLMLVISIIGTLKTSAVLAFLIPVLVVALPVTDVAMALIRRARRGQGLMTADRLFPPPASDRVDPTGNRAFGLRHHPPSFDRGPCF